MSSDLTVFKNRKIQQNSMKNNTLVYYEIEKYDRNYDLIPDEIKILSHWFTFICHAFFHKRKIEPRSAVPPLRNGARRNLPPEAGVHLLHPGTHGSGGTSWG